MSKTVSSAGCVDELQEDGPALHTNILSTNTCSTFNYVYHENGVRDPREASGYSLPLPHDPILICGFEEETPSHPKSQNKETS